ncbi:MAG: RNA 2',3'-cyclic phosphodiesterase [Nanobdellota archaeon]
MRLFIAIDLSDYTNKFSTVQHRSLPSDLTLSSSFHLTLIFLGSVSEKQLPIIIESLHKVRSKPFTLLFDHIDTFSIHRKKELFWMGVSQPELVIQLRRKLLHHLVPFCAKSPRRFIPHVTLAKRKSRPGVSFHAKRTLVPSFQANISSFVLVQSTPSAEGYRYTVISRFKL